MNCWFCSMQSLTQACVSGDVELVKVLLKQGRSIHETTEDGESLLSLAASSGYYELCQVGSNNDEIQFIFLFKCLSSFINS